MRNWLAITIVALVAAGCTKKESEPTVSPTGKPMITREAPSPDHLVLETTLNISAALKGKMKKTDLLIWDLKDGDNRLVAGGILPVPAFPYQFSVKARQLKKSIPEDTILVFGARIVGNGDEFKPPKKGQLYLFAGMIPPKDEKLVKPAVDPKILEKFEKKMNLSSNRVLNVGSKVDANFSPMLF